MSACLNAALLVGCADGGSSVTHLAGIVPAAAQQGTVHSGVRRSLSVPSCLGFTGPDAFIGINNSSADAGQYSVVGGGQNNEACDPWSTVVGGSNNSIYGTTGGGTTSWGFIGGGFGNVLTGSDEFSAIVAGDDNQVLSQESAIVAGSDNSVAAIGALVGAGSTNTIAAGGVSGAIVSGDHNSLSGNIAFIGGGSKNTISTNGQYGAIVSGLQNNLSGEYGSIGAGTVNTVSSEYGVIAGGISNKVSGAGGYIAAGGYNTVSGEGAVIDGGFNSTAAGTFATIPGGYVNSAAGTYSFAAGARASAAQTGTFVWSDGSDGDAILTSSAAYQFLARASGGFTFWTNAGSTVGATLAAGSGTWASLSDRNVKTNIAPLDETAVLEKVAALPISRWSYKSERGVRHVGPMAQDFYAAFGVGADDKHITSIDEDGVALAAIKALHAHVNVLEAKNAHLRAASASQSARIAAMQAQLQRLSAQVAVLNER
jgi:hypothetical protein